MQYQIHKRDSEHTYKMHSINHNVFMNQNCCARGILSKFLNAMQNSLIYLYLERFPSLPLIILDHLYLTHQLTFIQGVTIIHLHDCMIVYAHKLHIFSLLNS